MNQNNNYEEEINNLKEKLEKLENTFKEHQHLGGTDGSKELSGETKINAKEIVIHGAGAQVQDLVEIPFYMLDAEEDAINQKRMSGFGISIVGEKGATGEQINMILGTGKNLKAEDEKKILPSNRLDFSEVNLAQILLTHSPQSLLTFLQAYRTPVVTGHTGTITLGASTLTDSSAKFQTDQLVDSILSLLTDGVLIETRKITSNTENVITVDEAWEAASGSYDYEILTPIYLGSANAPYKRLYVGEDIRLGYGASAGTQVRFIKWGADSPEGVVTANPGSLYLNSSGGVGTTLYVKESGVQTNTGWVAK
jgi:hypothetical protein